MYEFLWRFIVTGVIVYAVFHALWWLAVPLALFMVLSVTAYELLVGALLIDVYFAPALHIPYYTLAAATLLAVGLLVRPFLRSRLSGVVNLS